MRLLNRVFDKYTIQNPAAYFKVEQVAEGMSNYNADSGFPHTLVPLFAPALCGRHGSVCPQFSR